MSGYEDEDDYRLYERGPDFPVSVQIAGIIWIAFGTLGLVNAGLSFLMTLGNAAAKAGQPGAVPGNVCGSICIALFAIAFLFVGIQTVKGTAKSTLGNGIGSIIFGLLYGGMAVVFIVLSTQIAGPAPATLFFVFAGFSGVLGIGLLAAGLLALAGKQAYEDWRAAKGFDGRPRRSRRRDREDRPRRRRDEEDRPRRRDEGDDRMRRREDY
jgi:hypothetical protein